MKTFSNRIVIKKLYYRKKIFIRNENLQKVKLISELIYFHENKKYLYNERIIEKIPIKYKFDSFYFKIVNSFLNKKEK